jgi:hypothetical protein
MRLQVTLGSRGPERLQQGIMYCSKLLKPVLVLVLELVLGEPSEPGA